MEHGSPERLDLGLLRRRRQLRGEAKLYYEAGHFRVTRHSEVEVPEGARDLLSCGRPRGCRVLSNLETNEDQRRHNAEETDQLCGSFDSHSGLAHFAKLKEDDVQAAAPNAWAI